MAEKVGAMEEKLRAVPPGDLAGDLDELEALFALTEDALKARA
jgi:hypothetical protein